MLPACRATDDYGTESRNLTTASASRCPRGDEPRTNNECIPGNENASRETAHAAPERDPARDPCRTRKVAEEYDVRIFLLLLGISIALLAVSRCAYFERAAVAG